MPGATAPTSLLDDDAPASRRASYASATGSGRVASGSSGNAVEDDNQVEDDVEEEVGEQQGDRSSRSSSGAKARQRQTSASSGPAAPTQRSRSSDAGPRIYDHDLIRTDARLQTLDKVSGLGCLGCHYFVGSNIHTRRSYFLSPPRLFPLISF